MAERTRKVRMLDAPDHGDLTIELRYLHNKDMRSSASDVFIEGEDAKMLAFLERFSQHVIKSWSAGEYDPQRGLAWLLKLRDTPGGDTALNALIARAWDPADFGIPRLVDATDLGNE